ncbi:MAG TPA: response regulator [Bryobacteraceae bacterium]|nr:response regulator [Bryobacteraceae bacterium]
MKTAPEIFVVEDSPGDVALIKFVLNETGTSAHLSFVTDGEAAVRFLRRESPYSNAPRPDLIILDWNLPKLNGAEVLKAVKSDYNLKQIPVLVFTASDDPSDVAAASELNADRYVTKPADVGKYFDVMRAYLADFLYRRRKPLD